MMLVRMKKNKKVLITLSVVVCLFVVFCFLSYAKFGVVNPFSTGFALTKVMFTNTKYVEVQEYPKVIIAKPESAENNLAEYMKNEGFNEDESGRMGALMRFENEASEENVLTFV